VGGFFFFSSYHYLPMDKTITKQGKEPHEQFHDLSAYLQAAREEERKSIAREIHDELGQALTTIKLELSLLQEEILHDATAATDRVQSMKERIDATIQTVKSIITKLRPGLLDDLGLTAAIEWQANDFARRTGIVCDITAQPVDMNINPEISTAIFRIFQELLTNISRHANATHVLVQLHQSEDKFELQVHDNGRGITSDEINDPKSFGLIGMRERAQYWRGTIQFEGLEGRGTIVAVRFPLLEEKHV
jgi:signal transduction histidine kinase